MTEFLTPKDGQITLYDVSFVSLNDIESQIHDYELERQKLIGNLKMFIASNPSDMFEKPIDESINDKVIDLIDDYDNTVKKIFTLVFAKRIIERYKYSTTEPMTDAEAFERAVIDKYADIREEMIINKR